MNYFDDGCGIDIKKISQKFTSKKSTHSHPYYELLYIKTGGFNYFIKDTIITVPSKSIILVNRNTMHKANISNNAKVSYYIVKFFDNFVAEGVSKICKEIFSKKELLLSSDDSFMLDFLFSKLYTEYIKKRPGRELALSFQLSEIVIFLSRMFIQEVPPKCVFDMSLIESVILYINENFATCYGNELSLDAVAKRFFMTPSSFSRFFKSNVGIGFKEYILSAKITYAKQLMNSTNLTITQIAQQSGFSDSNYFSTVFKRMESSTPSDYEKFIKRQNLNIDRSSSL